MAVAGLCRSANLVTCFMSQVLMNSKLPVDVLGRIWDMSDIDKDGYLDRDEFAVVCSFSFKIYVACS